MKLGANDVNAVKIGATDVNKVYLGSNLVWEKAGGALLLDLYPNAAAAYSLRKLRAAYAGAAIEARRSSDNAVQDIGFVGNELDTASLLTFANGGDVSVAKWYDQSGNGNNDAAQVSQSFQPQIVSSGIVIERNSTPAVQFGNGGMATANPVDLGGAIELWLFMVVNITDASTTQILYETSVNNSQNNDSIQIALGGSRLSIVSKSSSSRPILSVNSPPLGTSLISFRFRGGQTDLDTGDVYINGVQQSLIVLASGTSPATFGNYNHYLGARNNSSLPFLGDIQFVDIMTSDQSANRASIESIINNYCNVYWDGSQTGLLDDYPSAVAAYSLRALSSAYTGPAIEVRKTVGGVTSIQDIGFLYDGSLDTESLLSFANGGDVSVAKWYDQSGNSINATQTSASKQPQIVSSGSVINENGKISVKFNGTTDYIENQLSVGPTVTAFAVSKIVSKPDYSYVYDSFGTGGRLRFGLDISEKYFADNGEIIAAYATTEPNGFQNLFFTKHTNSDVSISVNQDTLKTISSTNFSQNSQYFVIGARNDGAARFLDGTIQELIFYPTDQSANRASIETNINTHYTIY